jgi:hypothetical protein
MPVNDGFSLDLDPTTPVNTSLSESTLSIAVRDGSPSTQGQTEIVTVTFPALQSGDHFSLGGVTVTASADVPSVDVAAAFANLGANGTPINTVDANNNAILSFTGTLAHFTIVGNNGGSVTFTSDEQGRFNLDETLAGLSDRLGFYDFGFNYSSGNQRGVDWNDRAYRRSHGHVC